MGVPIIRTIIYWDLNWGSPFFGNLQSLFLGTRGSSQADLFGNNLPQEMLHGGGRGFFRDNGKENGNYRDYRVYIGIIGVMLGKYWDNRKMETIGIIGFI